LIEEITGDTYEQYVHKAIFEPLEISRAGYANLDSYENSAGIFRSDGGRVPSLQYASSAATGLNISSHDLAKFVISQISRMNVNKPINAEIVASMRVPHGRTAGADIWGLGTILYAPTPNGDYVFGHDGANDPAINTAARINPDTGDAILALVSGHTSVATRICSEWVLWQTGFPDVLATEAVISSLITPVGAGCVLILLLVGVIGFRRGGDRVEIQPNSNAQS